jgi:hypothetical protein
MIRLARGKRPRRFWHRILEILDYGEASPPRETRPEIPNPAAPLTRGYRKWNRSPRMGGHYRVLLPMEGEDASEETARLNKDSQAEYAALYALPDGECCAARLSAIAPIQVDPCPAVQPKQCPPTAIGLPASLE